MSTKFCPQTGEINNHFFATFTLSVIMLVAILFIAISTIKELQKLQKVHSTIKWLYYLSFIQCLGSILSHMTVIITCSTSNNIATNTIKACNFLFYFSLLLTMLLTLVARLHYTFKDSMYRTAFIHKFILAFIILILCFLLFGLVIYSMTYSGESSNGFFSTPAFVPLAIGGGLLYILGTIYSITLFVKNLMKLVKIRASSVRNVMDENAIKLNKNQTKLINEISRYVSLISMAILITLLMIVLSMICTAYNDEALIHYTATLLLFDAVGNILLLSLQFAFANKYYKKYCQCIKVFWYFIFATFAERSMESKLKSMMAMQTSSTMTNTSNQTNASQISTAPDTDVIIEIQDDNNNDGNVIDDGDIKIEYKESVGIENGDEGTVPNDQMVDTTNVRK